MYPNVLKSVFSSLNHPKDLSWRTRFLPIFGIGMFHVDHVVPSKSSHVHQCCMIVHDCLLKPNHFPYLPHLPLHFYRAFVHPKRPPFPPGRRSQLVFQGGAQHNDLPGIRAAQDGLGVPQADWMVYFMENPHLEMDENWDTVPENPLILGKPPMHGEISTSISETD